MDSASFLCQPALKPGRQFYQTIVGVQVDDVFGPIQHRGAVLAFAKMRLHRGPEFAG